MVDDRCPRCDDYDEVVEELKKEKDARERGAKDELRKCEEKNKSRDKKIKTLEKKILTMTIAAVVGGTIVGKDVLDKIAEYIQSFNSIKDTANKLISALPNEPPPEENKNDEEVEELEYTRTLTLAPRKVDTSAWPVLMSTSDIKAYQNKPNIDYMISLSSLIDTSMDTIPTITDMILDDMLQTPIEFDNDVILSDSIVPPLELTPLVLEPVIPYTFVATQVPESHTAFAFAFLPMVYTKRRR